MRNDPRVTFGIRPYRADDIPQLFGAARESIRDIFPWLPWCHPQYSPAENTTWVMSRAQVWQNDREYSFVIFDQQTQTFVGGVGLNAINRTHQLANLGYWVRSSYTGRGAATVATRLAARFGLQTLQLERVELVIPVENAASQRVAEKAGARREGILRKRLVFHGQSHDAALYSFVKTDLPVDISGS